MDLNRLTRDADDLIRKVVSRYNQLYVPEGQISQIELDLMLDDMRKLYDTFKTIGHINLTLQHKTNKPELLVNTAVRAETQHTSTAIPLYSEKPSHSAEPAPAAPRREPEPVFPAPVAQEEPKPVPAQNVFEENNPPLKHIAEPEPEHENKVVAEQEPLEPAIPVHPVTEKFVPPTNPEPSTGMLADRFNTGNKSLSDTMASSQAHGTMGSRLLFQPISDLMSGIGLNDKFSFISELFGTDSARYEEAIIRINKAVNIDEAGWILQKYHAPDWDHKEETVGRLKEFIRRRFI